MNGHHLTLTSLLRLLAVMALVLSPHLLRLPLWETALVSSMLGWRALAALRQWPLPPVLARVALTLFASAAVVYEYRGFTGQNAGTALLVAMAALKLSEMRTRRDVIVTVFLMYFVLVTHFLYSQEIWTIAFLLGCTIAITAILIDVNHAGEPLPVAVLLRLGAVMIGYSLPLMVALFILFPRIPGPLWGLPSDSGAPRSGLPSSMAPGGLSQLIRSNEVAFRVKFFGPAPPMEQRYWRGPIFDLFDGVNWKEGGNTDRGAVPQAKVSGEPLGYEVILEPQRTTWLMALDLPSANHLPPESYINTDYQLVAQHEVRERLLYRAQSYLNYELEAVLPPQKRASALQFPGTYNRKTIALARGWRAEGLSDEAIVKRALTMFREQKFFYTLSPPSLGRDSVDQFLFETRRGFCEHYASAFTLLMRAAGIPAHVSTGYLGGEMNEFGDYYVVRQSDAHAWSEAWLPGRGWVRFDPTGMVAPERIEKGLSDALGVAGELPDYLARHGNIWVTLNARWDWVNNEWNRLVLAYGPELQEEFMRKLGLADFSEMIIALTVITTLMLSVVGLLLVRQMAPASNQDAALKLWRRACARLARKGLVQRPDEGPRDFAARASRERPELAAALAPVLEAYLQLRYLQDPSPDLQAALAARVQALKV